MTTGAITYHAKVETPAGYLLCDGSAVSRTTYAALFSAIGTAFGAGDGSTTFNLPDLRGRIVFGYDSGNTSFDTLGETGGAKTINIAHSHTMNTHRHTFSSGSTGGPSSTIARSSGSQIYAASSTHTHTVTGATIGNQSDAGTNSQLSSTQSILNKYITLYPLIKT